jgi:hypothetical protein
MSDTATPQVSPAVRAAGDTVGGEPDGYVPAPASRRLELAGAAVALVVSVLLVVLAGKIGVRAETGGIDPRWWPRLLGLIGLGLSAILLVTSLLRPPPQRDEVEAATSSGWVRCLMAVGLSVAYIVGWPVVGFVPATVVLVAAATAVFGGRGVRALLVFPLGLAAFLYVLFHTVLKVPL